MTLYALYQTQLAEIVADCGGLKQFTELCEKLHIGTRLFGDMPTSDLAKRIASLHEWRNQQIKTLSAEVGEYTTCRHAAKYNRPELTEICLADGSSYLGYDLLDALETAVHEMGARDGESSYRPEERKTDSDTGGREPSVPALGRSG